MSVGSTCSLSALSACLLWTSRLLSQTLDGVSWQLVIKPLIYTHFCFLNPDNTPAKAQASLGMLPSSDSRAGPQGSLTWGDSLGLRTAPGNGNQTGTPRRAPASSGNLLEMQMLCGVPEAHIPELLFLGPGALPSADFCSGVQGKEPY